MKNHLILLITVLGFALFGCTHKTNEQDNIDDVSKQDLGGVCVEDAQCLSNFCDNFQCAMLEEVYGRSCVPAPMTEEGFRDGKVHTCGGYLCLDNRCRSCSSDTQCQQEFGAPSCYVSENRPGSRCGDPINELFFVFNQNDQICQEYLNLKTSP